MARYSRRSFLDATLAAATGLLLGPAARAAAGMPAAAPAGAPTEALALLSIREASFALKARKISPLELTRNCLARIEAFNPALNAFITVTAESAMAQAAQAESEIARGSWRGPLHGIPLALKDLIDTAGVRTTSACAVFKDRIPDADAAVVERLRAAGAVLLGKLNMQECAYGGTSVPSYYGRVCNPWDLERITGGSSGGAAAAVAAGLCYGALGSDTGGSVREPAAFCGIVGLKPTYGRVSIRGVMPLAASLDHIGPMTRTVADAAIMLAAIAGYDPADAASVDRPVGSYTVFPGPSGPSGPARPASPASPAGASGATGAPGAAGAPRRVGLPREFFFADLDPEIQAATDQAIGVLRSLGAQFREVPLEVSTDRTVVRAEAYAAQADFIARSPELYLPETLSKLRSGADIDAPSYIRARRALAQHRRGVVQVFSAVDLLLTPTTPVLPTRASDYPTTVEGAVALDGSLLRNTRPFNLSGLPTLSIPCGISRAGLPIGLQLSGPPWAEQRVLAVAQAFEQATDWHTRRPPRQFTG